MHLLHIMMRSKYKGVTMSEPILTTQRFVA